MTNTEDRIQYWLDREEVVDCLRRCARGMDRHDAELTMSAYHPDAHDDHGTFQGSATDFVSYVNGSNQSAGVHSDLFTTHQHYLMNHVVEIDDNQAHVETYYLMSGLLHNGTVSLVGGEMSTAWNDEMVDGESSSDELLSSGLRIWALRRR